MERTELLARFSAKIPVLDRGFLRLVDVMGDDGAIIEAARVSTGKGRTEHKFGPGMPESNGNRADRLRYTCATCGYSYPADNDEHNAAILASFALSTTQDGVCIEGDRRFIDYLVRHRHTSPLEQCEIKFHVKLPIFVARQMVRHRTASLNEFSGRYSEMREETFQVDPEGWRGQDTVNKQGSSGSATQWPRQISKEGRAAISQLLREQIDDHTAVVVSACGDGADLVGTYRSGRFPEEHIDAAEREFRASEHGITVGAYLSVQQVQHQRAGHALYRERLDAGVSKEMARVDLTLSEYTEWYWKCDLHNVLHFLGLRLDAHAQQEIRVYAEAIATIVREWVPLTWAAFEKHRLNAVTLSSTQVADLRQTLGQRNDPALVELLRRLGMGEK